MNAYDVAKRMYEARGENLDADIILFARHEFAWFSPENLILARCCPDYWFVQIAVGKGALRRFIELMPESRYRPLVAWARGLRSEAIKFYKTERIRKLCGLQHVTSNNSSAVPLGVGQCLSPLLLHRHHRMQEELLKGLLSRTNPSIGVDVRTPS